MDAMLLIPFLFTYSEDDEAMDVDSEAPKREDDLSEYNLDDYDEDTTAERALFCCLSVHRC